MTTGMDRPTPPQRAILWVLPTLAAFGPLLPVYGPFYAFRIAVLLLAFSAFARKRYIAKSRLRNLVITSGVIWLVSGMLLTPLASDLGLAVRELGSVAVGALLIAAVLRYDSALVLRDLRFGWVIAACLTGVIGTWEYFAGSHLSNYVVLDFTPALATSQGAVASTFGNPNAYGLFLATGVPVVISFWYESRRFLPQVATGALFIWVLALLLSTGSRLSLAGAALAVASWLFLAQGAAIRRLGLLLVAGTLLMLSGHFNHLLNNLPTKVTGLSLQALSESVERSGASGNVRINLVKNGLVMVYDTAGLGVGPGNFPEWLRSHTPPFPVGGTLSPHNAVIEIVAQYGVLATVMVLLVVYRLGYVAIVTQQGRGHAVAGRVIVIGVLMSLVAGSSANSTFWPNPSVWILVAIVVSSALDLERHSTSSRSLMRPATEVAASPRSAKVPKR